MSYVGELCQVTWAGREKSVSKRQDYGLLKGTDTVQQLKWLCGPGPCSSHHDYAPFDLVYRGPYGLLNILNEEQAWLDMRTVVGAFKTRRSMESILHPATYETFFLPSLWAGTMLDTDNMKVNKKTLVLKGLWECCPLKI